MSATGTSPRTTPLHAVHERLGASFTDFGGWNMPLRYGSETAEHRAVREAAGLFDLSHMGEVEITGTEAGRLLDRALVGRLSALAVGRAKYSLVCTEEGGVVDDVIVYRTGEDRFLVVPNAGNADNVAGLLASAANGLDARVADLTARTALVAVQGPVAERILLELVSDDDADAVRELRYYAAIPLTVAGVDALVARTGYTGEDGFELFADADGAERLWDAVAAAGAPVGLVPAGLAARDSLRLEAGMPLYGHELDLDRSPYEAGLDRVVVLDKPEPFTGSRALAAHAAEGRGTTSGRTLVGLRGTGRRAARAGYAVQLDGEVVGEVTSGQPSPTLGVPIALAYVDIAHAEPGTALDVDVRGRAEPFEVATLPFLPRPKRPSATPTATGATSPAEPPEAAAAQPQDPAQPPQNPAQPTENAGA